MDQQSSKRIFAAIKLHPGDLFLKAYNNLKQSLSYERITWVHPYNMHLTLKFFGETPVSRIPDIMQAIAITASTTVPFTITISDCGVFGSRYDPRVVWFGLEAGDHLIRLNDLLQEKLKGIGIFPDRQNFVPHLTVGRIKQLSDKTLFQKTIARYKGSNYGSEMADRIILFESILKKEGPVYITLHEFAFAAGNASD